MVPPKVRRGGSPRAAGVLAAALRIICPEELRLSVHPSVRLSIHPSIHPSVHAISISASACGGIRTRPGVVGGKTGTVVVMVEAPRWAPAWALACQHMRLRPISILRLSLLRLLDSNFQGNPMDMRILPLEIKIMFESQTL